MPHCLATSSLSSKGRLERGRGFVAVSPGALVVAAAIPPLFLHVKYQPGFGVHVGSTTANAYLSDFAVLAVVVAAVAVAIRRGWEALRRSRALLAAGALFLVWVAFEVAYGRLHSGAYAWRTHAVTAAKYAEYMLLVPALPLVLRSRRDLLAPFWSFALWSTFATVVGVAQFFGAAIFATGTAWRRQASFLSSADFAALSGGALLIGVVALVVPRLELGRRLGVVATVSGALGVIVAGALASVLGLLTALAAIALALARRGELPLRRVALAGALAAVVVLGAVAIRGSDLDAFARFLGATPGKASGSPTKVQTYAHRTLLSWIGWHIFLDHPALGVGWEGSSEPASFEPYLPAAHRNFPDEPAAAFPSAAPERRYGVQDVWIQSLADLGVVGFLLWTAIFAAGAWICARADSAAALVGLAWICLAAWLWSAQGFVAGIPLDALTWLAFGLAATGVAWRVRARA